MRTFLLLIHAFKDLLTRLLPQKKLAESGFAFIIHPRDMNDVSHKYPFVRFFPQFFVEFFLAYLFWPITAAPITGVKDKDTGKNVTGFVISIPMTASQMMRDRKRANKQIVQAVKLAEKKGLKYIGLGALTASLTRGGLDLIPAINKTTVITNGKIYTAKTVTDIVVKSSLELDLDKKSTIIAVVGAAGSIGSASAQILAKRGFKNFMLIDLGERRERVLKIKELLEKLGGDDLTVMTHDNLEHLKAADIIIAATNRPDALIKTEHLKPGAIVVDDAQPSDVDPEILKKRDDVLVLEGGVVHTHGIIMHLKTGLKHREDIFSCLAEVILLTHSKGTRSFVGEIIEVDFDALKRFDAYSDKFKFRIGDFQNSSTIYSNDDIKRVKKSRV